MTCFGELVGDPLGRTCWDKDGEIFWRRLERCPKGNCNNFQLLGAPNSTTCDGISFPSGANPGRDGQSWRNVP
jgi:hypothetical protein